ncbi:uncharacterized protein LOC112468474, partial [Temnothorax curvispinosus]|uniref:Uncharacterized protein LOC112468474 n=1 Tax=Temnothorax curvispinosus TaxID=300111 RepID=A0A6J1RGG9_9HYME
MKTKLVHHIRVNNLLKVPTSEKQDVYNKKIYRLLGSTLTEKYPHMFWDTPSTRFKKTKNTQIWSTFVHHISMKLKKRRNRKKKIKLRLETSSETTEIAEEENLSVKDAQKELKLSIELEIRSKNEISKVKDAMDICINKYFQTERNGEKTVKDLENDIKGSRCIYNFICSI